MAFSLLVCISQCAKIYVVYVEMILRFCNIIDWHLVCLFVDPITLAALFILYTEAEVLLIDMRQILWSSWWWLSNVQCMRARPYLFEARKLGIDRLLQYFFFLSENFTAIRRPFHNLCFQHDAYSMMTDTVVRWYRNKLPSYFYKIFFLDFYKDNLRSVDCS